MRKIGIINSGGDAQGLNAVIASAVQTGIKKDLKFVGFIKGWEGMLDKNYIDLGAEQVRGISHVGGTILHTVNKGRFVGKQGGGEMGKIPTEILELAKKNLEEIGVDSLLVIGGDGTLSGAVQLADYGVNIIGVPKTIDNDLNSTEQTFGFSTAVDVVTEALDRIHTTAVSHDRVIFVETMGRNVGWIALHAGLAGGADAILIPEFEFEYESLVNFLKWRKNIGRNYSVVVVSEGAKAKNEGVATSSVGAAEKDRPEIKLAGASDRIMRKIDELAPEQFEMRNVVLGHIQRGGSPNAQDRILSKKYGSYAIEALLEGKFGHMVSLQNGKMTTIPIEEAVKGVRVVNEETPEYQTAKRLGVFFN